MLISHRKKVLPNSPASHALRPRDFLFAASPSGAPIGDLGDLETLIAEAGVREAPLELFVFNADDETFRTASSVVFSGGATSFVRS